MKKDRSNSGLFSFYVTPGSYVPQVLMSLRF